MKKKDIKEYFSAIRNYDLENVKKILETSIDFLNVVNFAPPKKDDGQSGLQIAFKIGAFKIAEYLINQGANVNYIETSEINEWNTPVLHDCLRATVFQSNTLEDDLSKFEIGFSTLQLMLENGADPNGIDSYGNSCLGRVLLDANQMINHPDFSDQSKTIEQLRRVVKMLIDAGADVEYRDHLQENINDIIANYRFEKYNLM
jgi:ankyrin repeat protein